METQYMLHLGDALDLLPSLPSGSVDAVIADPPYSSGGLHAKDRQADPIAKYIHSNVAKAGKYASFQGDNRDQRSFLAWCRMWMSYCHRLLREGGYVLVFTDWRQAPTVTDALQCAGYIWRGIVTWDKTDAARPPHTGYFRHQGEYVVWGTKGPCHKAPGRGPYPGVIRCRLNGSAKVHPTEKPIDLMRQLVRCVPEGGTVLDPFTGSGTTGVGAIAEGRRFIGIELDPHWHQVAHARLAEALRLSSSPVDKT